MMKIEKRLTIAESRLSAEDPDQVQIVSFRTPRDERERILEEWKRSGCEVRTITFTPEVINA